MTKPKLYSSILPILLLLAIPAVINTIDKKENEDYYSRKDYKNITKSFLDGDLEKAKRLTLRSLNGKNPHPLSYSILHTLQEGAGLDIFNDLKPEQKEVYLFCKELYSLNLRNDHLGIVELQRNKNSTFLKMLPRDALRILTAEMAEFSEERTFEIISATTSVYGEDYRLIWDSKFWPNNLKKLLLDSLSTDKQLPFLARSLRSQKENLRDLLNSEEKAYFDLNEVRGFLISKPNDAMALRVRALALFDIGRFEEAVLSFKESYQMDPFYFNGLSLDSEISTLMLLEDKNLNSRWDIYKTKHLGANKGSHLLKKAQLYNKAGYVNKALEILTDSFPSPTEDLRSIMQLGQLYEEHGDYSKARQFFISIPVDTLILNPNAYNSYLKTLNELDDVIRLMKEYKKAMSDSHKLSQDAFTQFYSFHNSNSDYDLSKKAVEKALTLYPNSSFHYSHLAYASIKLEDYSLAKKALYKDTERSNAFSNFSNSRLKEISKLTNENYIELLENYAQNFNDNRIILSWLKEKFKNDNDNTFSFEKAKSYISSSSNPWLKKVTDSRLIRLSEALQNQELSGSKKLSSILNALEFTNSGLDSLILLHRMVEIIPNYTKENSVKENQVESILELSSTYKQMGGNPAKHHFANAFLYRISQEPESMKNEAMYALISNRFQNSNWGVSAFTDLSNPRWAFYGLRKLIERNSLDYENWSNYIWGSTYYGGSQINAVWGHEKCRELFPSKDCRQQSYFSVIGDLGDDSHNWEYYLKRTSLGNTNRYVHWYNTTRRGFFNTTKDTIKFDEKKNRLIIIDENGEKLIKEDHPYFSLPILRQKGQLWVKYDYDESGRLTKREDSSGRILKVSLGSDGLPDEIFSSSSGHIFLEYSSINQRILSVRDENGRRIDFTYSDDGEVQNNLIDEGIDQVFSATMLSIFREYIDANKSTVDWNELISTDPVFNKVNDAFQSTKAKKNIHSLNSVDFDNIINYIDYLTSNLSQDKSFFERAVRVNTNYIEKIINSKAEKKPNFFGLDLISRYHKLLTKARPDGVSIDTWHKWNHYLRYLENEKNDQKRLNKYRRNIENLQATIAKQPITLLRSSKWFNESDVGNEANWYLYKNSSVGINNAKINKVHKKDNGDILVSTKNNLIVYKGDSWIKLYHDSFDNSLKSDLGEVRVASNLEFYDLEDTAEGSTVVNTNRGTFLINKDYSGLTELSIPAADYIGFDKSSLSSSNENLLLYNSQKINHLQLQNEKVVNFNSYKSPRKIYELEVLSSELTKELFEPIEEQVDFAFLEVSDQGIHLSYKNTSGFKSIKISDIKPDDVLVEDGFNPGKPDTDNRLIYFLKGGKLYVKEIKLTKDENSQITLSDSGLYSIQNEIKYTSKIIGLAWTNLNGVEHLPTIITDTYLNFYKDYHIESMPIPNLPASEIPSENFFYADHEFGLFTNRGTYLRYSKVNLNYLNYFTPKEMITMGNKKITVTHEGGKIYVTDPTEKDYLDYNYKTLQYADWNGNAYDIYKVNEEELLVAEYSSVYKVKFDFQKDEVEFEKVFEIDDVVDMPDALGYSSSNFRKVRMDKQGVIWVYTQFSVLRYSKELSPAIKEFNFILNYDEFPVRTVEITGLYELLNGEILVVNSSERWNDYKGNPLSGGPIKYDRKKDRFEKMNPEEFPWFITSFTSIDQNLAILGTTSGFAFQGLGGGIQLINSPDYQNIRLSHPNLFLGTQGITYGDGWLFGSAAGLLYYEDDQWHYPRRINQLLPKALKYGRYGGNKIDLLQKDHKGNIIVRTEFGTVFIDYSELDPTELLEFSLDSDQFISFHNEKKLRKEKDLLKETFSNAQSSLVSESIEKEQRIKELENLKTSIIKNGKLNRVRFKTLQIDSIDSEINRTNKEYAALLLKIKQENPFIYQALKVPPLEIDQIRSSLPDNQCIIQYIPFNNKLIIQILSKKTKLIKEVKISKRNLFNLCFLIASELGERGEDWTSRGTIDFGNQKKDNSEKDLNQLLNSLYKVLILPIEDELSKFDGGIEVISEGALNYVPLESLVSSLENDKPHYLIEKYNFNYLSSLYLHQILDSPEKSNNSTGLLIGNPDFTLKYAEKEVEQISELIGESNSDVLLGTSASTKNFKRLSKNKGIIHLATHGVVNSDTISNSWLVFNDRKLSLSEVYGLDLKDANLVVLSACETGIGINGLETTSLARAFAGAGTKAIISSLWEVDDFSTMLLMTRYYEELRNGNSYSSALKNAKKYLINYNNGQYSNPKYWSSFILMAKL